MESNRRPRDSQSLALSHQLSHACTWGLFYDPILGNWYSPRVSSRASQGGAHPRFLLRIAGVPPHADLSQTTWGGRRFVPSSPSASTTSLVILDPSSSSSSNWSKETPPRVSVSACSTMVNNFKNVLLKIPTETIVIGRPLYHAQRTDAPWTMYIFCYLDETAALAVISKIVLPVTTEFVWSRSELADKKQLTGYGRIKLVSELFLPPLSDTEDRGGLVAVVWDNAGADTGVKNNNNGIFEIFVNSQDTVHESWLIHSENIDSNLVCVNLHASIMASCGREITNIAQYNFVNTEFASATF